jgi:hypothetical protein
MAKVPSAGSYIKPAIFIDRKPTTYNTMFKAGALVDVARKINEAGLPLLMNHNSGKFPVGMWFQAKVNEAEQVVAQFYIPKEIPEYGDLTSRIDTGILDSVSIGFSAGVHECSICGNAISDYNLCPHVPGKTYENATCYVLLDNIRPSEGSLVYSGAVPAAKIQEEFTAKGDGFSKEDFFKSNPNAYATIDVEIVQSGNIIQDTYDNFEEGNTMDALQELQEKYAKKVDDHLVLAEKYAETVEKNATFASEVAKVNEYKVAADEANTMAAAAKEEATKILEQFQTVIEALALPFATDYKAPSDFEGCVADLNTYLEKAKALPVGQQTEHQDEESVAEFSIADANYKV